MTGAAATSRHLISMILELMPRMVKARKRILLETIRSLQPMPRSLKKKTIPISRNII